jgi:hypothetical protein
MKFRRIAALTALLAAAACSEASPPTQSEGDQLAANRMTLQGSTVHVMLPKGVAPAGGGIGTNATGILYHGGPILPVTNVAAMYWANSTIYNGGPAAGTTGAGSGDGSLVGYFLNHLGGSQYFNINTTYTDTQGGGHTVGNFVNYTQFWANNVNVPPSNGSSVSNATIQAEIVRGFTTGKWVYDPATIYAVFTLGNTNLGGGFGSQYCAYHGHFTWNSPQGPKDVIFAAQPWVQQFVAGCSNNSTPPNGDAAADRVINVVAHEIEESTTDYDLNAWFDASGQENADKCAWMFGTTFNNGTGLANMTIGAKDFLIQMNWVNQGSGGCLQGLGGGTNQPPVAAFVWSCNSTFFCSFNGTGSTDDVGITGYSWKRLSNGNILSTASTFTKQFQQNATFDLQLTVTDGGGLSNAVTHTIVTQGGGGNQPPVANFVATNCSAATHTCTLDGSSSTDDVGIVSYVWKRPNGTQLGTGVTLNQAFPFAGNFSITLTVTDGGSLSNSITKTVVVP